MKNNKKIVVCSKCGCLYDLHYIDNVRLRKKTIIKFECKHCGLVDVVYKNIEHFQNLSNSANAKTNKDLTENQK